MKSNFSEKKYLRLFVDEKNPSVHVQRPHEILDFFFHLEVFAEEHSSSEAGRSLFRVEWLWDGFLGHRRKAGGFSRCSSMLHRIGDSPDFEICNQICFCSRVAR